MTIEFSVPGRPVPMARPRVVRGHAYTPKRCVDYKRLVAAAARDAMQGRKMMTGAVACLIELYYAIPKSYTCGKRLAAQYNKIKPTGRNTGDTDNCAKSIMDSLNGVCWGDDAQVTRLTVYKRFDALGGDCVRVILTEDD